MYSLHRVSECAFLFLIHLCYFILMLQLVLSENYIDKQSFKLVCGMQRNRFTKYINVRSRVICTGICARLDQCVGIKFDNGNNCIIYKDFQDCDKTYISSCLHLKRDTMLDLSKPWCKTTSTETASKASDISAQIPKSTTGRMFSRDTTMGSTVKTTTSSTVTTYSVTGKTDQTTQKYMTSTTESIMYSLRYFQTTEDISVSETKDIRIDSISSTKISDQTTKITTQSSVHACEIDAATKLKDSILLISGLHVYFYNNVDDILKGTGLSVLASTIFPQITEQITAAYTSLTFDHLYVIVGKIIYTYTLPSYTFIGKQTDMEHFGLKKELSFIDNIIIYENGVHVFSTSAEFINIHNGQTNTLRFDNNGKHNPYRSTNKSDRPMKITAVSHLSNNVVLFFQSNIIHKIEFGSGSGGKGIWTKLGSVLCSKHFS